MRLLPSSAHQFCSSLEGEAWSLSIDRHQVIYLRHEEEVLSGIFPVIVLYIFFSIKIVVNASNTQWTTT